LLGVLAAAKLAIRDARKRYAIDCDRTFVAGQLGGGNMAWDLALSQPDLFAGAVVWLLALAAFKLAPISPTILLDAAARSSSTTPGANGASSLTSKMLRGFFSCRPGLPKHSFTAPPQARPNPFAFQLFIGPGIVILPA